jgi:hypothetical protein
MTTPTEGLPNHEARQSIDARPGIVKSGFMTKRARVPIYSMNPKSVSGAIKKLVKTKRATKIGIRIRPGVPPVSIDQINSGPILNTTITYNMAPNRRDIDHKGLTIKRSRRKWFSVTHLGFKNIEKIVIIAENETIVIPIYGSCSLSSPRSESDSIPITIVIVPSFGIGIKNTAAPISEGIKKRRNCVVVYGLSLIFFLSIHIFCRL